MTTNYPTTVVLKWLAADGEQANRLHTFYTEEGLAAMRAEAEDYLITHADRPPATALSRWGADERGSPVGREQLLIWVCEHVDWERIAERLSEAFAADRSPSPVATHDRH